MDKKMKIVWSLNVIIPEAAKLMGLQSEPAVTWLDHLSHIIRTYVDLTIIFPTSFVTEKTRYEGESIRFEALPRQSKNGYEYENDLTRCYEEVINEIKPDVIHQWGTEFPNAWNMVQAVSRIGISDRVIVSIQGLIGVWGREELFYAGLPVNVIKQHSLKDYIRKNSLKEYREKYLIRGTYETKVLQNVKHVIGRTGFDQKETTAINSALIYHHNNETLRETFYEGEWSDRKCIPHRVFISQAGMPYKGFHLALEALGELKKDYPDLQIAVTGRNLGASISLKEKLSLSAYEQYIRKLIKKYNLSQSIEFLGKLNAEEMKEQYLQANVFLLPSSIENSPNSLGEAMLLGVPSVAADVGGVRDLMKDESEGLLYNWFDVKQLAEKLRRLYMENASVIQKRTENAKKHALKTHNPEMNLNDLLEIYRELSV